MRRDIDPIKIIKILPLSNRPETSPSGQNPWSAFLKKAFRVSKEAVTRLLSRLSMIAVRVRLASRSLYGTWSTRMRSQRPGQVGSEKPSGTPSEVAVPPSSAKDAVEHRHHPNSASLWLMSIRQSATEQWSARKARLALMRQRAGTRIGEWGGAVRQAFGTQDSWRQTTEQFVQPLTSAIRSLRRRHQDLLDRLHSAHCMIQQQQEEIADLASRLASVRAEVTAHKRIIEDLTVQITALQSKVSQILPSTHGTTGQSGPPTHGRRGAAVTKRNGQGETGPQSRAEH